MSPIITKPKLILITNRNNNLKWLCNNNFRAQTKLRYIGFANGNKTAILDLFILIDHITQFNMRHEFCLFLVCLLLATRNCNGQKLHVITE
jgi:hypothetical protein